MGLSQEGQANKQCQRRKRGKEIAQVSANPLYVCVYVSGRNQRIIPWELNEACPKQGDTGEVFKRLLLTVAAVSKSWQ